MSESPASDVPAEVPGDVPPAVPADVPTPFTRPSPTVGQRVDRAIADGQRLATAAAERARAGAANASPRLLKVAASANAALDRVSHGRPWVKPALIGVAAFVIALALWTAVSSMFRGGGSANGTSTGSNRSEVTSSSNPRQEFIDKARNMGQIDAVLAQRAIEMVEQQGIHKSVGWQAIDEMMYQATPETRSAYRNWRKSVQSQ